MRNRKRSLVLVGLAVAALMAMSTVAYASLAGSFKAGKVNAVQVATGGSASTTTNQAWTDVPGSEIVVKVGANKEKYLLATYSAESRCERSGATGGWCSLRIMLDGTELEPAVGTNFAFDSPQSPDASTDKWEAHSIQRVIGPITSGTYTVKVQYQVTAANMSFALDDWVLSLLKAKG